MNFKRKSIALGLVAATAVLAACGAEVSPDGDDSSSPEESESVGTVQAAATATTCGGWRNINLVTNTSSRYRDIPAGCDVGWWRDITPSLTDDWEVALTWESNTADGCQDTQLRVERWGEGNAAASYADLWREGSYANFGSECNIVSGHQLCTTLTGCRITRVVSIPKGRTGGVTYDVKADAFGVIDGRFERPLRAFFRKRAD